LDRRVVLGPGDDCAVVKTAGNLQLLKSDCIVEGIHFLADADPMWVGWKAMCRSISDIASMGGLPLDALVTVAIRSDVEFEWLKELYRGLRKAASTYLVNLVGGETARSPGPLFLSVTLTGMAEKGKYVSRSGGRRGDWLFVTGKLGGSIDGKHLRFSPRVREARWLVGRFPIHAMMDLSDGLGSDLPRLAAASGVGFEVALKNLPLNKGLRSGKRSTGRRRLRTAFSRFRGPSNRALNSNGRKPSPGLQLTPIGRLVDSGRYEFEQKGFDHFRGST